MVPSLLLRPFARALPMVEETLGAAWHALTVPKTAWCTFRTLFTFVVDLFSCLLSARPCSNVRYVENPINHKKNYA